MSRNDSADDRKPSIEIVDGVARLMRTSPSQVKTFHDCPRKWWYDKRAKLPRKPPSKGQILGTQCHGRVEHFLLTGEDGRGRIELAGRDLLTPFEPWAPSKYLPPGTKISKEAIEQAAKAAPLKVECSIGDVKTPAGVVFIGFSDLMLKPGLLAPDQDLRPAPAASVGTEGWAWVVDHKFKKDLAQYADTKKDLENDAQKVIYSFAAVQFWPDTRAVVFVHHNHQTQGRPEALPVAVFSNRDQIIDSFGQLAQFVDRDMQAAAAATRDLDVPFNGKACEKFGGCDFAVQCPNSPRNRFLAQLMPGVPRPGITISTEGKDPMGLIDNARAAMAAAQTQAPAAAQPAQQAQAPVASQPAPSIPQTPAAAVQPATNFTMAGQAVVGRIYSSTVIGGLGQLAGVMGNAAVFKNPAGGLVQAPVDAILMDVTDDPISRGHFGLAATTAAPAQPAAAQPAQTTPAAAAPVHRMPIQDVDAQGNPITPGAGSAVVPPDASPPAANPEQEAQIKAAQQATIAAATGQPAPASMVAAAQAALAAAQPATTAAAAQPAQTQPATTAAAAPAEAPKKRGRPPGSGRKAAEGVATGTAQAETLGGLILIVNAAVSAPNVTDLTGYVADLADAIASAAGAADPRLCDPKGPFGYGAWKGAMRAAALKTPPTGVCTISRGDLADPVIEALSEIATMVVRG